MTWKGYYEKNKDRPLRDLYLKALGHFSVKESPIAFDLGCGAGTETLDLLQKGFQVHALDPESSSRDVIEQKCSEGLRSRLTFHLTRAESFQNWPSVDLFCAFNAFPFCEKSEFLGVLQKSLGSVEPGGIFAASFFGMDDEWVLDGKVCGTGTGFLRNLLADFELLHFDEIQKQAPSGSQAKKQWHLIEVIAKKGPKTLA